MSSLERHDEGAYRVWTRPGIALEPVLAAIHTGGTVLKASPKAVTWRSGDWVVKETAARPRIMLKQAFTGARRRQAFDAALFLEEHNVPAPRPVAYAERRIAGLAVQCWVLTEFLDGCVDVEAFLDRMIQEGATDKDVSNYLAGVASAVNKLVDTGAHHRDLAGKNILTRSGRLFHFIDLDAIDIDSGYFADDRFKNHVQLYDSFCDRVKAPALEAFIAKMRPETQNIVIYMGAIRKAQRRRRARTEKIWRKQGRQE